MAVEYKFKPYAPTKLKKKEVAGVDDVQKSIKSLEKQRENLDERLRAEGIDPETLGGEFDNRNLLEKALNLKPNQGLLMDFFEVINRPVEAVKSMLTAGNRGDDALTGFAEGLSGKQVMSGAEFNKQFLGFEAETKLGKFLLNIGTDIALDPLTYLPPGIIAKGLSKLNKLGGRTVTRQGAEVMEFFVKNADDIARRAAQGDEAAKKLIFNQAQIDDMSRITASGAGSAAENQGTDLINKYLKQEGLEDLAPNFKAVQRGGSKKGKRFLKDVELYYKNADDQWVRTGVIEVKDMTSATGAFAFKSTVNPSDLKPGGVVSGYFDAVEELDFIKNVDDIDASTLTKAQKKTYESRKALKNLRQNIIDGKLSIEDAKQVFNNLSEADKLELDKIAQKTFFDDLAKSNVTHISVKTKEYGTVLLAVDDAKKLLKVGRSSFMVDTQGGITRKVLNSMLDAVGITSRRGMAFAEAGKQKFKTAKSLLKNKELSTSARGAFITGVGKEEAVKIVQSIKDQTFRQGDRLFTVSDAAYNEATQTLFISGNNVNRKKSLLNSQLNLAEDATIEMIEAADKSKSFLGDFVTQRGTGKFETITETLTFTQRFGEGDFGETLKNVAQAMKKFEIRFKLTFNLTAGFDEKTKALIMRAKGADMFDLERRSGILADIKKKLIEIDPEAGPLLGELIEADAKIVNGKVQKLKRQIGTSDMFDYMYSLITKGDGGRMAIPKFANADAERKFLEKLNTLYQNATGSTDIMFTVRKGKSGSQVLAFAGDASEMRDLIKYIKDAPLMNRRIPDYLEFGEKVLSRKAIQFLKNNVEDIERYRQLTDELLGDLVDIAGFSNMPAELADQIGYMRHTMTKEAMEGLRKQMPGVLSIYTSPGGRTLGKRNIMGSVQEINAVMRDFYDISEDFFDPNAFNAMEDFITQVSRKMDQRQILDIILTNKGVDGSDLFKVVDNTQAVKATMSPYDTMIKDFREDFKTLYENLAPDAKKAFDDFLTKNGYGPGKAIQLNQSAYNVLKGVEKAYFDVPQLAKIYDKFLNTWKGLTLITPGFHMRNLFGNMFNSYAVGMDVVAQGKYLGVAMQELNTFQEIGKKLAQGADLTGAERKIYNTVKGYFEQGVSQTHRGIRDLEGVMEASAKQSAKGGFKNTYNNVVRINFNFAEKMDDVQRYALYRWSLDKTNDSIKAANTVAEALFDYSHLTPFEKSYMKRLFPFYTFMKNNFVFQMKNIFRNPAQYAKLGRAYKYASEDLAGYSLDDLPDYATENMWIPLPWTVDKNDKDAVAFLKATLPVSDFTELVENPFKKGVTSITAPIKLMIEFGAGKDLFTGQPLEAFPGQKSAMPEGTGVLSSLRDRRGNLTISQSPLFIKIMNDLGLRAPINIASAGLDIVDTLAGYQGTPENIGDFLQRAGIAGVSEMDRLKLSRLYQDLEKLRELKKFYEQETGNQLPVLPRG